MGQIVHLKNVWGRQSVPPSPETSVNSYINSILYHFSKSGTGWAGGIENIYHDPCQDWLDLANMKLTSPNYPKAYNPLENCTWTIKAPQGHYVTVDFIVIDVSN